MGVQVICAGGLPSVSSGIGAGERLLKSGNFWGYCECDASEAGRRAEKEGETGEG
jgi:hypothetical protein